MCKQKQLMIPSCFWSLQASGFLLCDNQTSAKSFMTSNDLCSRLLSWLIAKMNSISQFAKRKKSWNLLLFFRYLFSYSIPSWNAKFWNLDVFSRFCRTCLGEKEQWIYGRWYGARPVWPLISQRGCVRLSWHGRMIVAVQQLPIHSAGICEKWGKRKAPPVAANVYS